MSQPDKTIALRKFGMRDKLAYAAGDFASLAFHVGLELVPVLIMMDISCNDKYHIV